MKVESDFIGLGNAGEIKKAVLAAIDSGDTVIDLSGVTRAQSVALSVLLSAFRRAQERAQTLEIRALPKSLELLAHVYGVSALLGMEEESPQKRSNP